MKTMNICFLTGPMRNLTVTLLCLILGATNLFSEKMPPPWTGFIEADGVYLPACWAALLLTPEQTITIKGLWTSSQQEILRIRGTSSQLTDQQFRGIDAARKLFVQKREEVLTPDQRDTLLTVLDLSKSVRKTIYSDFKQQDDDAFTREEKVKVNTERSKALADALQKELKTALPADRFAAFQAAQGEQ